MISSSLPHSTASPRSRSGSHAAEVGAYYDSSHWWYRLFYSDAESLGIHYGFWSGPDTKRADALIEPYLDVMRRLRPIEGHRILDAGCGIGGATLWMADHSRAHYTGITLSEVQRKAAQQVASRRALTGRVDFQKLDYRHTGLPAASFDGVFTIESLCYAYPEPEEAFEEILRLLKPGGRYVMLDGVLNRKPANLDEERLAKEFCAGFRMRDWNTRDEILARLKACGFEAVEFADRTAQIRPSVEDIDRRHHYFNLMRTAESLGVVPAAVLRSLRATGVQRKLYDAGLFGYGVFAGTKTTKVSVPSGYVDEPPAAKRKIAILGGGVGACTAAYYLSQDPRNEITLYQMGWRLGGKGASGRNRKIANRIEEHGLHTWFGFYHNAFRMIQEVYQQCQHQGLLAGSPIQTWRDAFKQSSSSGCAESLPDGSWDLWVGRWPVNDEDPGLGEEVTGNPWALVLAGLEHMVDLWDSLDTRAGRTQGVGRPEVPPGIVQLFNQGAMALAPVVEAAGSGALHLLHHAARQLPADGADHQPIHHWGLGYLLEAAVALVQKTLDGLAGEDPELRRVRTAFDFGFAALRGCLADGVILNGFDVINDQNFIPWLERHGCNRNNDLTRAFVDAAFSYADGDPSRPDYAAGVALRAMLLVFFDRPGAVQWRMQAGMGDIVFSPIYLLLKKRGVRFEFFHFVEDLVPDPENRSVAEIRMLRQVDLAHGAYDPLFPVEGVPSWPSEPFWEQLQGGEALERDEVDFESYWAKARWPSSPVVLRAGEDFDAIVMGISLGAIPFTAGSLVKASPRWQRMVADVKTVPTQAFQLWLNRDVEDLGWKYGDDNPFRAMVCGYVEPHDTWADMSHLIPRESWPVGEVRNISYFCNAAPDGGVPLHDPTFPERQLALTRENARGFLQEAVRLYWPRFFDSAGQPDLAALVALGDGTPEERFAAQFFRMNFEPSERFVQSVTGSVESRLPSDDSGYANLMLAGDWTRNGLDTGCVEAAVLSGMDAAAALRGTARRRLSAAGALAQP